ncbi:MAG: hypothetical protein A2V86_11080 [Deltaproteobacteria bacterium RBG_16_49_23]|nr:MAG: hypothetical protein A2V86_11080 [Deltaproteobacteria bacterium RBG_16_49_23]
MRPQKAMVLLSFLLSFFLLFGGLSWGAEAPEVFVQSEYPSGIYAVAFHPKGKYVLSGGMGHNLWLWDVASGRKIRTFLGHSESLTSMITSIAFSPDGRSALTGFGDGTLKLWEVETGKEVRTFQKHSGIVRSVAFSPDGKYGLSGSDDQTIRFWEVETGKEIRAFSGRHNVVRSVAFSPDGKYGVSGSEDQTIRLWEVETGKEVSVLRGHLQVVTSVCFSPDGKYLLSGSVDKTLKLWDVSMGREFKTFLGHLSQVTSVAFSPDGKYGLSGSNDNTVRYWNVATGAEIKRFQGHSQVVTSVSFSPDGTHALSGSWDKTIRLWDVTTGKEARRIQGYLRPVRMVSVSPDGRYGLFGTVDTMLKLWDLSMGKEVKRFKSLAEAPEPMGEHEGKEVPVFLGLADSISFAISPDSKYILCGAEGTPLKLLEIATGKEISRFVGHEDLVPSIVFSPDGKYGLSGSIDKTVKLWDIAKARDIRSFSGHVFGVISVAFSPDGRYVYSGARDSTVKIWETATGKEVRSFKTYTKFIRTSAFSQDGKYVLIGGYDSAIKLLEMETGREVWTGKGHSGMVTSVALSRDGKTVLSGSDDKTIKLWDVMTGREIRVFHGHSGKINSVAFGPGGKTVLSGSDDGTTRIWAPSTGKELARLISFLDGEWIALTPAGHFQSSPGGARLTNVRIKNSVLSLDNFYERFFNPERVALALRDEKTAVSEDIRKDASLPPEIRIIDPVKDAVIRTETVTLTVEAKDRGGGIGAIRLYHNGSAIGDRRQSGSGPEKTVMTRKEDGTVRKVYEVTLVPGDNLFRALGLSREGSESDPHETLVRQVGGKIESDLYLIVVGINDYQNLTSKLQFPIPNAKGIKEFFEKKWKNASSMTHLYIAKGAEGLTGASLFKKIHITELYDREATKEGLRKKLFDLRANPQDILILYVAGQSRNIGDEWQFVPYDAANPLSFSEISEMVKNLPPLKKVVIFDLFKSGGPTPTFVKGLEESRAMALMGRSTGAYILSTSTYRQDASEIRQWGRGLFAYALLQGLNGEAENPAYTQIPMSAYAHRDKIVTIRSLMAYLENSMLKFSEKVGAEPLYPLIYSRPQDFPLVINKWND